MNKMLRTVYSYPSLSYNFTHSYSTSILVSRQVFISYGSFNEASLGERCLLIREKRQERDTHITFLDEPEEMLINQVPKKLKRLF